MQSSGPEQHAGRDARSARRRLIRGAFGAPAALTLYSGSALAATSLTCVAKRVRDGDPNPPISSTNTVFVRVQLRSKLTGANRSVWVYGGDLLVAASLTVANANMSFLGADGWYCFSAGNGSSNNSGYTPGTVYLTTAAMQAVDATTPTPLANSYVAIRVDANGQIVGVTSTTGASAVSQSCWTSFVKTV